MYCYTYLPSLECGLRELILWSEISSQHPVFFINVAQCLNLNLTPQIVADLNRMKNCFNSINNEARPLLSLLTYQNHIDYSLAHSTSQLMQQFLHYDQELLAFIQHLKAYGQNQPVWQTLVSHIENEQIYMYRLISTLREQIFQSQQPPNMMPPKPP
ncbi:DUF2935 domain-containing protein [Desulfoscipio gibsoniae]|uniref:DUF2935 domain-containing protein n=1 Tax=Desulfoscipio gibsoniae DSM 7213 TaxID=767817 RepID=R4KN79_9FIRM|nr:DUF2935 domain-containing protein [Desulfoscipio gibsoniae]AGL01081.1 hypothetical protein Desgi_1602 [Desulfoscipio gibsoniae DSM 7213]